MNPVIERVTKRIRDRSAKSRGEYITRIHEASQEGPNRNTLSCSNLAHGVAASAQSEKESLTGSQTANIGIVSAYNDMLSAHQPFESFPKLIRQTALREGAIAQFAGGVPAMCDGVTQGQPGMDLSLFSRDVIALSTAVALSHNMFDAAICLGICDKIVPGLLIGALSFGQLPVIFVPAGPMVSGLANKEKARIREEYAAGQIGRDELLAAESASYHSPGTCTFYGTANSNQMLMEFMGLQLPGGSFVNPGTELRDQLTEEAVRTVLSITNLGENYTPIAEIVTEKAIVNGIVGLLATGGSTNHTIHLVAVAAAAGIKITWDDFSELSSATPLLARVYPNGLADVNHFHAAGGIGFLIRQLLGAGLLHEDVQTILGYGLSRFCVEPANEGGKLTWKDSQSEPLDSTILSTTAKPFDEEGGLRVLEGNIGRAMVKVSAVESEHYSISAPASTFNSQAEFVEAFNNGDLEHDMVAVLPYQGPSAIGMPELHKLTPYLGVLQNRGFKVALLTDGRMSGASGKVLAAIHVTPEALHGGVIGKIQDGDMVSINANSGEMLVESDIDDPALRESKPFQPGRMHVGMGRDLFSAFRSQVQGAEDGASIFGGT
jgi:phosphogluconate dehydratase